MRPIRDVATVQQPAGTSQIAMAAGWLPMRTPDEPSLTQLCITFVAFLASIGRRPPPCPRRLICHVERQDQIERARRDARRSGRQATANRHDPRFRLEWWMNGWNNGRWGRAVRNADRSDRAALACHSHRITGDSGVPSASTTQRPQAAGQLTHLGAASLTAGRDHAGRAEGLFR